MNKSGRAPDPVTDAYVAMNPHILYSPTDVRVEAVRSLCAMTEFGDTESDHAVADSILCSVLRSHGLNDVADAYEAAKERCGFWYA